MVELGHVGTTESLDDRRQSRPVRRRIIEREPAKGSDTRGNQGAVPTKACSRCPSPVDRPADLDGVRHRSQTDSSSQKVGAQNRIGLPT